MEKDSEIVKLTERIAKDPKSKLFVPLAEEYKKIGDIEMAINVLQEGLKNNPGYITARSSLGRLLMENGDLEGARKELEEVIKAIPDNLLAQRKLGDLFILTGRTADALDRYKTALALNPNDKDVKSLVEDLSAGKDVSARIPKPKPQFMPPPPVSAAPESANRPLPQQPQAVPPAAPKTPAGQAQPAVAPKPAPLAAPPPEAPKASPAVKREAAPQAGPAVPRPAPAAQAPVPQKEPTADAESVEEIVEIEHLEHPATPSVLKESPAEASFDLSEGGAFEIAGSLAEEGTAVVIDQEPQAWEPPTAEPVIPAMTARPAETNDDINTNTLAELYVTQGFYEKAIEIYEGMLAERPDSTVLQKKLEKIRAMAGVAERNAGFAAPAQSPVDDMTSKDLFAGGEPGTPTAQPPAKSTAGPEQTAEDEARTTQGHHAPSSSAQDEHPQPTVPSGPQARRKETIDRLESWLKNIMKEKP